jgi:hypothetical protein
MDPAVKEAMQATRNALGAGYATKLRAEADAVAPGKLGKRKHQINSLYHAAKMKVRRVDTRGQRGTPNPRQNPNPERCA